MLRNSGKGFARRGNKKDSSQIPSAKSVRGDFSQVTCFTRLTSFMLQPSYYASRIFLPLEGGFVYLGFYVAFNTVQVTSRRVGGRAEETST